MEPIDINSLWGEKNDEDKRQILILDTGLPTGMFANKEHVIVAHFAREPGIMIISIEDLKGKTRDEVIEIIYKEAMKYEVPHESHRLNELSSIEDNSLFEIKAGQELVEGKEISKINLDNENFIKKLNEKYVKQSWRK